MRSRRPRKPSEESACVLVRKANKNLNATEKTLQKDLADELVVHSYNVAETQNLVSVEGKSYLCPQSAKVC